MLSRSGSANCTANGWYGVCCISGDILIRDGRIALVDFKIGMPSMTV